jgi:hypothetical protein
MKYSHYVPLSEGVKGEEKIQVKVEKYERRKKGSKE